MSDKKPHGWMQKRHQALISERSDYDSHIREIVRNLLPRLGRFSMDERNRGGDRNRHIIDSTGTRALRVLTAGMMSGMTSPARPWFRVGIADLDLSKDHNVKMWLHAVTQILQRVFTKSNTYNTLHTLYRELGGFGTGYAVTHDDFDTVIHHNAMTFGQYALGLNEKGTVDTASREFQLTVKQAVEMFGVKGLSSGAVNAYDRGDYHTEIDILHTVEPRPANERDTSKRDGRNMRYKSVYAEFGRNYSMKGEDYLRESGYRFFPGVAPRWDVLFNDTYGASPAMEALGDLKQLQQQQFMKAKAIDYQADPPVQVPKSMQGSQLIPGGVVVYDGNTLQGGVRTAYEVPLRLDHLQGDIAEVQARINSAFYADMFLMLATADRTNMTATEVAERHEEKLLMLGPVLERLHNELLSPLITTTFTRALEAGILPPAPEELGGASLDIEFISMLAQAQKAVSVNATDRLIGHIGVLANAKPDVVDVFDADKSVEAYADALGVNPDFIVPSDKVALIRQERAQAQQAAAAAEQAKLAADAMGKMGTVQTGPSTNAGADILNLFSNYQSPSGVEL